MPDIKDIARGVVEEIFGKGQYDLIEQYFAEDYLGSDPLGGKTDRDGMRQEVRGYMAGFPDKKETVDEVFAAGDAVCVRWSVTGTNTGPLFGIPPTNKTFALSGIRIFHFKNGKITEDFTSWDRLALFEQLGIVSGPREMRAPTAVMEQPEARPTP